VWLLTSLPELGGVIGYELNLFFASYIGKTGTLLLLLFGLLCTLFSNYKLSPEKVQSLKSTNKDLKQI
jgi:S-DNA-T family DNA segregation ATPase FtsK/SpoIIIE